MVLSPRSQLSLEGSAWKTSLRGYQESDYGPIVDINASDGGMTGQGFVHNQLRQRTDAMLAVLEQASFAAGKQKARKTATGRTFVEQTAPV